MKKYDADWWRMAAWWRLNLLVNGLIDPCSNAVGWLDKWLLHVFFGRGVVAQRFFAWMLRLSVEVNGRWSNYCYGWMEWSRW